MPAARFSLIRRIAAVFAGALLITWPAFYNGYPLLYPDSMSYLEDGGLVARAVFLHRFSPDYGGRSFIYCLGILPFHWNITPWPVVALNAVLTAYVIWLVVRSIASQHTVVGYFALILPLSFFTGMAWFVSLIMPDILGPVLYLSMYLLVFARESLSPAERLALMLIAWWAVASHVTHLMLAAAFCILLAPLLVLRRSMRKWLRGIGEIAAIVLLAAAAHLALHAYLYGKPSLNGLRPPFLMARVIVDGPGRAYLERHCGDAKLVICEYLPNIPNDSNEFLWNQSGIWQAASPANKERLRQEEMPVVLATLRAYPRQELSVSAANFWDQLTTFGMYGYGPNPWVLEVFEKILPGALPRYLKTHQALGTLPYDFSTAVQDWALIASLLLIGILTPFVWRRRSSRLAGLMAVIVFMVIVNACVTGVMSSVEDRYQARVIWLVPLLAGMFVMEWFNQRSAETPCRSGKTVFETQVSTN